MTEEASDPAAVQADIPGVVAPPPLIFFGFFLVGIAFDLVAEVSSGVSREWRVMAGVVLGAAGLTVIAAALGLFIRAGTRAEPWRPTSVVVETGVYRRSRNPMYVGMALIYLGAACFANSLGAVLLFAPLMAVIRQGVVLREERYLDQRFGAPYRAYRGRVRRWL